MRKLMLAASAALVLTSCISVSSAPSPAPPASSAAPAAYEPARNPLLFSVLWIQTSAEYRAASLQAFSAATNAVQRAANDPSWTAAVEQPTAAPSLPMAVIVDVDETILDNSPYEARLIRSGGSFNPATWTAWVNEQRADPLPGAVEFAREAAARGATIFYVTNRNAEEEAGTRGNLIRLGFPVSGDLDTVLVRGEREEWKESDKSSRRALIAQNYRIVAMVGDDLGDFLPNARVSREERQAMVERYREWWGTRWFVIPNPMYGSWEGALTGGASTPAERSERLLRALRDAR